MGEMQATNGGVTVSCEANGLITTGSDVQAYFVCSLAIKQKQFDDDSYEAVLLEELSDMRDRFQQQVHTCPTPAPCMSLIKTSILCWHVYANRSTD
eukprot:SAG31_NODE_723_length_12568_cov_3.102494_11_plen_96_part_00